MKMVNSLVVNMKSAMSQPSESISFAHVQPHLYKYAFVP
jgi:hypothetical protein